jgi:hypothetical protein
LGSPFLGNVSWNCKNMTKWIWLLAGFHLIQKK